MNTALGREGTSSGGDEGSGAGRGRRRELQPQEGGAPSSIGSLGKAGEGETGGGRAQPVAPPVQEHPQAGSVGWVGPRLGGTEGRAIAEAF